MLKDSNQICIPFSLQSKRAAERERKKAEVRKRLEEAGRAKKAKKGFLTPERKKKLRVGGRLLGSAITCDPF